MTSSLRELLEERALFEIGKTERDTVRFVVHGGMCELEFVPGMCCGPAQPGIAFTMKAENNRMIGPCYDGKWHAGMGCFTLADATKLRDMLDKFIREQRDATQARL